MLIEKNRTGEFILSEANGTRSRTEGTMAQVTAAVEPGTVVGIVTATKQYAPYDNAATDGSETAKGILYAGVDSTAGVVPCVVIDCDAEVVEALLVGLDSSARTDLASIGIKLR